MKEMRTIVVVVEDNYTKCVSNTQRYKALGNGWTVDVVAYILNYWNGSIV